MPALWVFLEDAMVIQSVDPNFLVKTNSSSLHLIIIMDCKKMANSLLDRSKSEWKSRFKARNMVSNLVGTAFSVASGFDDATNRFLHDNLRDL